MFARHDSRGMRFRGSLELLQKRSRSAGRVKDPQPFFWAKPDRATPITSLASR